MKPILSIFIFIFSVLRISIHRHTTKSTKSTHCTIFKRLSTLSTLSCVDTGKRIQQGGAGQKSNSEPLRTGRLWPIYWGVFCKGGGVRKLALYSIYAMSEMVFRGFAGFEGAVDEAEGKLSAHLVGGNGGPKKLVAEGVILAGSLELDGGHK